MVRIRPGNNQALSIFCDGKQTPTCKADTAMIWQDMRHLQADPKTCTAPAFLVLCLICTTPVLAGDWGGFLIGGSISQYSRADSAGSDSRAPGLHFGYNRDYGRLVLGGELEVDRAEISLGATDTEEMRRIKLRAGYDFGDTLGYVTFGGVRAEAAQDHSDGSVIGFGISYSLDNALQLSGEFLHHSLNRNASNPESSSNALSLRASFQF